MIALIPLLFLTNADRDSQEYDSCIKKLPCAHDGEDLSKLHKPEYMKTMQCRIKRHMECIKTEIEHERKSDQHSEYGTIPTTREDF